MRSTIGLGHVFERWDYERSSPSRHLYATVWLQPAPAAELRVVEVTTQSVTHSLGDRFLTWLSRWVPALRD